MPPTVELSAKTITREFLRDAAFQLHDRSLPRIARSLEFLNDDEVWIRPNANTVSIGNLMLHLDGNVRQWIVATLGGAQFDRNRQAEFDERGPIAKQVLLIRLTQTVEEACAVLERLDPIALITPRPVQDETQSGISIITRVVEHFSYHTGQIAFAVKSRKNIDLAYYTEQSPNR